jgi:hypothetical protein
VKGVDVRGVVVLWQVGVSWELVGVYPWQGGIVRGSISSTGACVMRHVVAHAAQAYDAG